MTAKKATDLVEELKDPAKKVKRETQQVVSIDDDEEEDDEDDVELLQQYRPKSSPPRRKKHKTDHPSQPSGFGYYFTAETSENFSLIVLRTPNTKCSVSAISTNNISLKWEADTPKDEILEQIGGGLRVAYTQINAKKGEVIFKVGDQIQQNQSLWTKSVTAEHAIFVVPKVASISEIAHSF